MRDEPPSDLERRLRRIAVIVPALAAIAAITGFVPDGLTYWTTWVDVPPPTRGTTIAGGWTLAAWTAVQLAFARAIVGRATRTRAWWWFASAIVTIPVAFFVWTLAERGFLFDDFSPRGIGHVTFACAGAAAVLLVVVLPIVTVVSRDTTPSEAPTARVV